MGSGPNVKITPEMIEAVKNAPHFHASTRLNLWVYFERNGIFNFGYVWFTHRLMTPLSKMSIDDLEAYKERSEQCKLKAELYELCQMRLEGFYDIVQQKAFQDAINGKNTLAYLDRYDSSIKRKIEIEQTVKTELENLKEMSTEELLTSLNALENDISETE